MKHWHLVTILVWMFALGGCQGVDKVDPIDTVLHKVNEGIAGVYSDIVRWSPDGRFVAVVFHKDDSPGIWIYELSTRLFFQLIPDNRGMPFTWLSDHTLAFREYERINAIDLSTAARRTLFDGSSSDYWTNPNLSWAAFDFVPGESQRVVVEIPDPGPLHLLRPRHIYELDLDTGQRRHLSPQPDTDEVEPRFSPDGEKLAFYRVVGFETDGADVVNRGERDIVVVDGEVETTYDVAVSGGGNASLLSFSPRSDRLLYFSNTPWDPDHLPYHAVPGLYLLNLDQNSIPRLFMRLEDVPGGIAYFDWSAANRRLAIVTVGRPGRNELLISDPITEEDLQRLEGSRGAGE